MLKIKRVSIQKIKTISPINKAKTAITVNETDAIFQIKSHNLHFTVRTPTKMTTWVNTIDILVELRALRNVIVALAILYG